MTTLTAGCLAWLTWGVVQSSPAPCHLRDFNNNESEELTMFSFDPIVRAIDGVRVELARANDLTEESIRLHRQRYKEIAETEAKLCEQNRISVELIAIAHGYEKNENGYSRRVLTPPEKL